MLKYFAVLSLMFSMAYANNVGISTHPFTMQSKVLNTEIDYIGSNGTGTGVNVRYFQRLSDKLNLDAGMGANSGERSSRLFLGADYVLYPDYSRQPRVSIKGLYSFRKEFDDTVHNIGFAPTISKGFNVYGKEVFPFISIPLQLGLNSDQNTYDTISSLNIGATGRLPIQGYENYIVNLEAQFDLDSSYNAIVLGISLPIN
jgi:hypothetical protein